MQVKSYRAWSCLFASLRSVRYRSLETFDIDIGKLNLIAVVLQCDRALRWDTRQMTTLNHRLVVQYHANLVTLHGNLEPVPSADRFVGFVIWCGGGANFRW